MMVQRKEADRVRKARERTCETCEQTSLRLERERTRMASTRASETHEETLERQKQDRVGFKGAQHAKIQKLMERKQAVVLDDCQIKKAKRGSNMEVILNEQLLSALLPRSLKWI